MKLLELITDANQKTLSHTKLWANIAYSAATFAFIKLAWLGQASFEVWCSYLGCVAGASTASKLISLKYASQEK